MENTEKTKILTRLQQEIEIEQEVIDILERKNVNNEWLKAYVTGLKRSIMLIDII